MRYRCAGVASGEKKEYPCRRESKIVYDTVYAAMVTVKIQTSRSGAREVAHRYVVRYVHRKYTSGSSKHAGSSSLRRIFPNLIILLLRVLVSRLYLRVSSNHSIRRFLFAVPLLPPRNSDTHAHTFVRCVPRENCAHCTIHK